MLLKISKIRILINASLKDKIKKGHEHAWLIALHIQ